MLEQLLVPPGNGVFTVNTAKEKKEALQQKLFTSSDPKEVEQKFYQRLSSINELQDSQVGLLGVCSDTGGGIMRGANWGPLFIREKLYQGTLPCELVDFGDCKINPHLLHDKYLNQDTINRCQTAMFGKREPLPVSPLSVAETVCDELYKSVKHLKLFSLGGDHSVSYPLVTSYLNHKKRQGKKVGLIHFDAHTDLLSERLGIDLCFGSWLTHVLPNFDNPLCVAQIGIRSTGKEKEHWEKTFGLKQYWAREVKAQGVEPIAHQVINQLKAQSVDEIYLSFDIDALDAEYASATGTPEPNGLTLDEALEFIELFGLNFCLTGADLVEVAPLIGNEKAQEATLESAKRISLDLLNHLS